MIEREPVADNEPCCCCNEVTDDVESTYCGSMCGECREQHAQECDVCRQDFIKHSMI